MAKQVAHFLIPLLLAISANLHAQDIGTQFGVKGGLTLATMNDYSGRDLGIFGMYNTRQGHIGLFWYKYITPNWGYGTEILYNPKGGRSIHDINETAFIQYALRLDYLSIPLLAKYRFDNFALETGLELSYKWNVDISNKNAFTAAEADDIWDKHFDAGILFGITYQLKRLLVGVRYTHGLPNQVDKTYKDEKGAPITRNIAIHNQAVHVSLGLLIISKPNSFKK